MKVIAIDPGERVGWCTAEYTPGTEDPLKLINHGISLLKPFACKFYAQVEKYDVIIYEKFVLFSGERGRSQIGGEIPTAQLVGMIRLCGWMADKKLVSQSVQNKKTGDKVAWGVFKELIDGEVKTHDDAHDIDAIRHLVYWAWKQEVKHAVKA